MISRNRIELGGVISLLEEFSGSGLGMLLA
jgi:hypothetical protein